MGFEGKWHPGPWMVSGLWGLDPVFSALARHLRRVLLRASGLEEDGWEGKTYTFLCFLLRFLTDLSEQMAFRGGSQALLR